jgi:alginate O-acetyltransferase complex protein AlgI
VLFNSIQFLVFFPMVLALYFTVPQRMRWMVLLSASFYFYMVFIPKFVLILVFVILIDYIAGLLIERSHGFTRRLWLILSLVCNIGVLGFFKYFNFISTNVGHVLSLLGMDAAILKLDVPLPVGLSFHVFQSMSYTIEVYRGNQKAERHLGIYSLYVMFFPQLVAGPIERPQNLIQQFKERHFCTLNNLMLGLSLALWGFFKKLVIADRLAPVVDAIYAAPGDYGGAQLLMATYAFAIQIYCDFSGYSDIAIGIACMMGIRLMTNFERPYFSKSISEFWRRWHISLSTWFRDYVYVPLGGNRVRRSRWYLNLMIVFLLSGLWHGASWTFVVWGGIHGAYLIFGVQTQTTRDRIYQGLGFSPEHVGVRFWRICITFHLVAFAWIFFRAQNFGQALDVIGGIAMWRPQADFYAGIPHLKEFSFAVAALMAMEVFHWFQRQRKLQGLDKLQSKVSWRLFPAYASLALIILCFGKYTSQSFIYFQF